MSDWGQLSIFVEYYGTKQISNRIPYEAWENSVKCSPSSSATEREFRDFSDPKVVLPL